MKKYLQRLSSKDPVYQAAVYNKQLAAKLGISGEYWHTRYLRDKGCILNNELFSIIEEHIKKVCLYLIAGITIIRSRSR